MSKERSIKESDIHIKSRHECIRKRVPSFSPFPANRSHKTVRKDVSMRYRLLTEKNRLLTEENRQLTKENRLLAEKHRLLTEKYNSLIEEELVDEVDPYDFVFNLKPKKEYTVMLEIKSIKKAEFEFVDL